MSQELILGADSVMVIPTAPGRAVLTLDVRSVLKTEGRLQEIQAVTRLKAGELMHSFNQACLDSKKHVNEITKELAYAERHLAKVKAHVIFDKIPDFLSKKGLTNGKSPMGSEDLRTTLLNADDEFAEASEIVSGMKASIEFFEIRHKSFERAYYAVHKLTDIRERTQNYSFGEDLKSI